MKLQHIIASIFLVAVIISSIMLGVASPVAAQVTGGTGGTGGGGGAGVVDQFKILADKTLILVNTLVPIAFTAALLFFFWGLAKFILNPDERESGRNLMIWGVIALFVIASVWGITKILGETVGVDTTITTVKVPGVK